MGSFFSKPKVDTSAQEKAAAEAKAREEAADKEKRQTLEQERGERRDFRRRLAGRASLITNVGGVLGIQPESSLG